MTIWIAALTWGSLQELPDSIGFSGYFVAVYRRCLNRRIQAMQSWHTTYLGLKELPRELSAFELQAFFTYSRAEREVNRRPLRCPSQTGPGTAHGVFAPERSVSQRGTHRAGLAVDSFRQGARSATTGAGISQSHVRPRQNSF